MILVRNIRDIEIGSCDEIWAIVRSMKSQSKGIKQVVDLSPSWELFKTYRGMSEKGDWNQEAFQSIFVPQFLKEIKSNKKAVELLNYLYKADKENKIIGLVCFCNDETMCHRSIIAGLLQGVGCNVKVSKDYTEYYEMFKSLGG